VNLAQPPCQDAAGATQIRHFLPGPAHERRRMRNMLLFLILLVAISTCGKLDRGRYRRSAPRPRAKPRAPGQLAMT